MNALPLATLIFVGSAIIAVGLLLKAFCIYVLR